MRRKTPARTILDRNEKDAASKADEEFEMALFDEDNPGKNLANATIWLESSSDTGGGDGGGGGPSDSSGCGPIAIGIIIAFAICGPGAIATCASGIF